MNGQGNMRRVVKLGGSLLGWSKWPRAFAYWVHDQTPASTFLVVGGGASVDAIRQRQEYEAISDEDAHWQAIDAMSTNANRVARELGAISVLHSLGEHPGGDHLCVLDPQPMMREAGHLPCSWDFTSDSIAAWIACQWRHPEPSTSNTDRDDHACELVLLKSCDPIGIHPSDWVREGHVDTCFGEFAQGIPVRSVHLRRKRSQRRGLAHSLRRKRDR